MKPFEELFIVLSIIVFATGISMVMSQKSSDVPLLKAGQQLTVRNVKVKTNKISRGDYLNVTVTIFNNGLADKNMLAGVFLLDQNKTYGHANIDYASRSRDATLKPSESIKLTWEIPIYIDPGQYKLLAWLHNIKDGNEEVAEDSWYPGLITVYQSASPLEKIRGEDSLNATLPVNIAELEISPITVRSDDNLLISYQLKSNYSDNALISTGVYFIEKSNKYTDETIASKFAPEDVYLKPGETHNTIFAQKVKAPPSDYRVLIWTHRKAEDGTEKLIEDYFAPGYVTIN